MSWRQRNISNQLRISISGVINNDEEDQYRAGSSSGISRRQHVAAYGGMARQQRAQQRINEA